MVPWAGLETGEGEGRRNYGLRKPFMGLAQPGNDKGLQ